MGFVIALLLGLQGKWRWLGILWLFDFLIIGTAGLINGAGDRMLLLIPAIPLAEIGAGYMAGMAWYRRRNGDWPRDSMNLAGVLTESLDDKGDPVLSWQAEDRLANAQFLRIAAIVLLVTFLFVAAIMALVTGGDLGAALAIASIGVGALAGLLVFVVWGLFFNRIRRQYAVAGEGYAIRISDPRMLASSASAVVAGAASAEPAMAGAGLLAGFQADEFHAWDEISGLRLDPERSTIILQLGWRGAERIRTPPRDFNRIASLVEKSVEGAREQSVGGSSSAGAG